MRIQPSALTLTMLLGGCSAEFPSGRLACDATSECPDDQVCLANAAAQLRCFTSDEAGAKVDDGSGEEPLDAGRDTGMSDEGGCGQSAPDPLGIYVSKAGTDNPSCGSQELPCLSVSTGIGRAKSTQSALVYVGSGTYQEAETLTLAAGVTVMGGWNQVGTRWTRQCVVDRAMNVVIEVAQTIGVLAAYEGAAALDALTIRSGVSEARFAPGTSHYAIVARGAATELTLIDVIAEAAPGAAGKNGKDGEAGAAASGTCAPATGAAGSPGVAGASAIAGSFTAEGYVPASGAAGQPGTPGSAGSESSTQTVSCVAPGGTCTLTSGACTASATIDSMLKPGAPGCGGNPGAGGDGGEGGGSSVGLFVADATVTIVAGALRAGDGGAGGAGGMGGGASDGVPGAAGETCAQCRRGFRPLPLPELPPQRLPTPFPVLEPVETSPALQKADVAFQLIPFPSCIKSDAAGAGHAGGNGGAGGAGGRGGDGAAGSSFAIFTVGVARVLPSPETVLAHGAPGTVTGNGAAGSAGDVGGGGT